MKKNREKDFIELSSIIKYIGMYFNGFYNILNLLFYKSQFDGILYENILCIEEVLWLDI